MATNIIDVAPNEEGFTLVLHGGAGGRVEELSLEASGLYEHGLRMAYEAGAAILSAGGSALDAVCETVRRLEDNPLFNAGRGAALTATGSAELDACVMTGEGKAGAVAVSRSAKNPVDVARAVLEESEHVFLVTPSDELVDSWGLERVQPGVLRDGCTPAPARERAGAAARGIPPRNRRRRRCRPQRRRGRSHVDGRNGEPARRPRRGHARRRCRNVRT